MKQKISISIEEKNVKKIAKLLSSTKYRNKSHFVEVALEKFLEEEQDG